jgi:signal transduction histidine kinase
MPEGGTLDIRAVEDRAAKTVTVSIQDSGSGITPEHQARLFQPMFTTKARRVGLGLVVVKNLTQANGGSVGVESEPGRGSTFTVSLPCDNPAVS